MAAPGPPSRRSWLQFSLRGVLVVMAIVGAVLAIWAWPWEEEWSKTKFGSNGEDVTRMVVTYRRDLFWKKRLKGPFRGYDDEGRKRAEGYLEEDGARYSRTYDAEGRPTKEMHREQGLWVTKEFDAFGRLTKEHRIDRQNQRQGKYYHLSNDGEEVTGMFADDQMAGEWTAKFPSRSTPGALSVRHWRDGKRHGIWSWPPLEGDSKSSFVEYQDGDLIRCETTRLPIKDFTAWLKTALSVRRPVNNPGYPRFRPYAVEGESLAYIYLQLDNADERWVEIGFPCGQPADLETILWRHHDQLGPLPVATSHPASFNSAILLEAAVRFDLVIDAVDGRLMITPGGEWCGDIFRYTGIQHVDFTAYPELAAAWQKEVRMNGEDQSDPLNAIRKMIADTPLKVDLSEVEPFGTWRPAIYGFGVPDGSIREQLRDVLFCSGLKCEQRGDTLAILPRWTLDREANYPPLDLGIAQ
jgi:YD repeat-containing protein